MHDFDVVMNRKGTASVKWDLTKDFFGADDVLPMWVADMDFPSPPAVLDALTKRIEHGIFGYTFPSSQTKTIVQKWLKRRHNWHISLSSIEFSAGIVQALSTLIRVLTEERDHIVIQPPVYHPFFDMVRLNNRTVVENNLQLIDGQYEINFSHLEEVLANEKTKLMLLCNPHNPSGRVWTKEELKKIGELCLAHNVFVISDEIHSDLTLFDHKHTPFASVDERFPDFSVTCIAPSKTFNLAGLQASAVIIQNSKIRNSYKELEKKQGIFTLNTLGITAMEAAYEHGEEWLNYLLLYIEENVKYVEAFLKEELPSLRVIRPQSTYLIWIDYRDLHIEEKELVSLLVKTGKLALEMGSKYGENGKGFVRMNIAAPKEIIQEGLKRLKKALDSIY